MHNASDLLDEQSLEASWVVANNAMNRERGICGANSYQKDLRSDLLGFLEARLKTREKVGWVDLCCGRGKALMETAEYFEQMGFGQRVALIGVDLVDAFAPVPKGLSCLSLVAASLRGWSPPMLCDLITCVHGLHYIGDKLALIANAASWLVQDGLFLAHLDRANVKTRQGTSLSKRLTQAFLKFGVEYHPRYRILKIQGQRHFTFPFTYVGARDDAGANFTGQPAVNSYYALL